MELISQIILDSLIAFFASFGVVCAVWCVFFQRRGKISQRRSADGTGAADRHG